MDNRNKDKAQNLGGRGKQNVQGEFDNMGDIHGQSGEGNVRRGQQGLKDNQGNLQKKDVGKTGLRQDRGGIGGGGAPGRDINR